MKVFAFVFFAFFAFGHALPHYNEQQNNGCHHGDEQENGNHGRRNERPGGLINGIVKDVPIVGDVVNTAGGLVHRLSKKLKLNGITDIVLNDGGARNGYRRERNRQAGAINTVAGSLPIFGGVVRPVVNTAGQAVETLAESLNVNGITNPILNGGGSGGSPDGGERNGHRRESNRQAGAINTIAARLPIFGGVVGPVVNTAGHVVERVAESLNVNGITNPILNGGGRGGSPDGGERNGHRRESNRQAGAINTIAARLPIFGGVVGPVVNTAGQVVERVAESLNVNGITNPILNGGGRGGSPDGERDGCGCGDSR